MSRQWRQWRQWRNVTECHREIVINITIYIHHTHTYTQKQYCSVRCEYYHLLGWFAIEKYEAERENVVVWWHFMLSTDNTHSQSVTHIQHIKFMSPNAVALSRTASPDEKDNELPSNIFYIVFFLLTVFWVFHSGEKTRASEIERHAVWKSHREITREHWSYFCMASQSWTESHGTTIQIQWFHWTSTLCVSTRMLVNCTYLAATEDLRTLNDRTTETIGQIFQDKRLWVSVKIEKIRCLIWTPQTVSLNIGHLINGSETVNGKSKMALIIYTPLIQELSNWRERKLWQHQEEMYNTVFMKRTWSETRNQEDNENEKEINRKPTWER